MTVSDFKKAFTVYNIAHYSNWHTSHINVKGTGKKFMRRFETPVDQDIIISVDYQVDRQIPFGCKTPDVFYNIYIVADNKLVVSGKAVNKQIAHGMTTFQAKKDKTYIVLIVNWADASVESDFQISTFGDKATAELTK
jgi:hypothetical protein